MSTQAEQHRTEPHGDEPALKQVMGPKLLLLFIVGDILGAGVYAVTGDIAGEVGGVAWLPFLVAFTVATMTAFSYLELVTKYPHAAGAALYTHKAFGLHFLTFLVAFTVVCSGVSSASTSSNLLAANGVDPGQVVTFDSASDRGMFAAVTVATAIAFFSMVGFEDSVNMVEECRDAQNIFPRTMLTGLGIAVVIYMLVAVSVVMVLPLGDIQNFDGETGILLEVVRTGAPGFPVDSVFPFLTVFAVANTALINMLMASRLIYGMAKQDVLPRSLAKVLPGRRTPWGGIVFSTLLALGLIVWVTVRSESSIVTALAGTTGLLLLCVFTIVNVACLVLRRDTQTPIRFRAPTPIPVVGAAACLFLAGPWARDPDDWVQYRIAAGLLGVGIVLWLMTWLWNRGVRAKKTGFRDVDSLDG
jgi:basic amino acid/polyamine antiporter, APA family